MDLSELPLGHIIQNCHEQTLNYIHRQVSDTKYCFELFRRAVEERSHDALEAIFSIYHGYLLSVAARHSMFSSTNEAAEYFAIDALRAFHFSMRPEKMKNFADVPNFLRYLAMCVDTSIRQYMRRYPQDELLDPEFEVGYTPDFEANVEFQKLWVHICALLVDETSILLARLSLIYQMKPQEIVEQFSHIWANTEAVRIHKQNILRKLRNDPGLRNWGFH